MMLGAFCPDLRKEIGYQVSKHQAPDEQPQASDISWIQGLAKPADSTPSDTLPFYGTLVARAPRHAAAADEPDEPEPASSTTGSIARISADRIDTVIAHLDYGQPASDVETPPAEFAGSDARDTDAEGAEAQGAEAQGAEAQGAEATMIDYEAAAASSRQWKYRKPMLIGAAATLCLLTIGGGTVTAMDKHVSIVIDGQARQVSTMADSVAGALAAAGVTANSHDAVAPAIDSAISDGSTIVLDRGRLVTLTVNGQQRRVWTTARTVDEALAELGTGTPGLSLPANRSRAIPVTGLAVTTSTPHTVELSLAGAAPTSSTTAATTVGDLLAEQNVLLGAHDTVSPPLATKLSDGLVITVTRVVVSTTSSTVALPQPAARSVDDAGIATGTSTVVQQGRPGRELITYIVTTVNGKQTAKAQSGRTTVLAPVGTVVHVGTKSAFTYVGDEVFTNDTSFGVNWDGLANCESTHNPKAVNAYPSAGLPTYGLFQFDLPTWATVGGSGNPIDASPQEQLMRAKLLYQQRGLEPWACGYAAH